eukprot:SAG31_NODE_778_length_12161_cov_101.601807_9_plen_113_part_00
MALQEQFVYTTSKELDFFLTPHRSASQKHTLYVQAQIAASKSLRISGILKLASVNIAYEHFRWHQRLNIREVRKRFACPIASVTSPTESFDARLTLASKGPRSDGPARSCVK